MTTTKTTLRDRMIKLLKRRSKGLRPIEIAQKLNAPAASVRRVLSVHLFRNFTVDHDDKGNSLYRLAA